MKVELKKKSNFNAEKDADFFPTKALTYDLSAIFPWIFTAIERATLLITPQFLPPQAPCPLSAMAFSHIVHPFC